MSDDRKCVIKHCESEINKLFSSPENPRRLSKWKQLIGTNKNEFFICELHFDEENLENEKILKDSALPSLFLNENEMVQECSCECCFRSIYASDRKYFVNQTHREIFSQIMPNFEVKWRKIQL